MWLLQPAKGRSAIRNVWRDWLRATPDYRMELVSVATEPATNDVFVMWRATGMSRLSLIPHRTPTNKPFEHTGVTRCVDGCGVCGGWLGAREEQVGCGGRCR